MNIEDYYTEEVEKTTALKMLLDGRIMYRECHTGGFCYFYRWEDNVLLYWSAAHTKWLYSSADLLQPTIDMKWYKVTKKEWFHNIPEGGILCWVWDTEYDDNGYPQFITEYRPHMNAPFKTVSGKLYYNAKPVTPEEVSKYIYKG